MFQGPHEIDRCSEYVNLFSSNNDYNITGQPLIVKDYCRSSLAIQLK